MKTNHRRSGRKNHRCYKQAWTSSKEFKQFVSRSLRRLDSMLCLKIQKEAVDSEEIKFNRNENLNLYHYGDSRNYVYAWY